MENRNKIQIIGDKLCWVMEQITWVSFSITLTLLFIQVICRYVLNMPLAWAEELVRMMYISVSFTGAAVALRKNEHITINIIPVLFKKIFKHNERKIRKALDILDILTFAITGAFWIYITIAVNAYMFTTKDSAMLTVAMQWPVWIMYIPIVVSGTIMVIHSILNSIEKIIDIKQITQGGEIL
ncbi:MAG: TRAP transporter small permease subunit [Peptostreptococcaceae bacterium]|nr:TRAP transporter small permease subunit [Peptostreptococcaceae bacterium]